MALILAYIIMTLLGGITIWIVARLFSPDPPNIILCFIGAAIAEFVGLLGIPFIPFIVLFIVLIKIAGFSGFPAFFATLLYGAVKLLLFGTIVVTLGAIF